MVTGLHMNEIQFSQKSKGHFTDSQENNLAITFHTKVKMAFTFHMKNAVTDSQESKMPITFHTKVKMAITFSRKTPFPPLISLYRILK